MPKPVFMPKFGFTQEEATIVAWRVHEGDRVEQGDPLCEVTTDKVNMEVEAPASGIIAGIRAAEGDTIPVTQVIATILFDGETLSTVSSPEITSKKQDPVSDHIPGRPGLERGVVKENETPSGQLNEPSKSTKPTPAGLVRPVTPVALRIATIEGVDLSLVLGSGPNGLVTRQDVQAFLQARPSSGKVRASPAARRVAAEQGIDLRQVKGTGPFGRVQGWDILRAGSQATLSLASNFPEVKPELGSLMPESILPLEGMRRTIARRILASYQEAPHIHLTADIDMTRALAICESANQNQPEGAAKISITAVLVKACATALAEHPLLNSYLISDQIYLFKEANIGMAVALEEGLIVPVIRDAGAKSLLQIAGEVVDLTGRAREQKLRPEDVLDGTFTISNLGMFGVDQFTAILNPPQVAILAVGRVARRFVPNKADLPTLREMVTLTLAVDHRAVDGAVGASFIKTLSEILENREF